MNSAPHPAAMASTQSDVGPGRMSMGAADGGMGGGGMGRPIDGPLADPMMVRDGSPSDPARSRIRESDLAIEEAPAIALPVALACGGAFLGALIWAGIAYATGMEIGYVAWAVGGLAGGGMLLGGGRGVGHAGIAAVLALVGIFGGKYYGTSLLIEHELGKLEDMMLSREAFDQMRTQAQRLADETAAPTGEMAAVLEDGVGGQLSQEEVWEMQEMLAAQAAQFARMLQTDYTYEMWRDEMQQEIRTDVSVWAFVQENFDFLDMIFILLGLSTAFGVVQRAGTRALV